MNNNQKWTGIVLIVVTMAAMFGLHTTFLVETAHADHSSSSCAHKLHRVYGTGINNQYGIDSGIRTIVKTNCATCPNESPSWHTRMWYYDLETIKFWYEHKYLIGLFWSNCHTHIYESKTWYAFLVLCKQPEST